MDNSRIMSNTTATGSAASSGTLLPASELPAKAASPRPQAPQDGDMAVLVPLLQRVRTQKLPPPSFAMAPAVPLPVWQRVTLSTLEARQQWQQNQRKFKHIRQNVSRELTRYHLELQERAERTRQQQREARARVGERVAAGVHKFWSRRGDAYQQLVKVEFDVVKHQHDRRKQEDLLRETEMLTRKLLESFFAASGNKTSATPASESPTPEDGGQQAHQSSTTDAASAAAAAASHRSTSDGTFSPASEASGSEAKNVDKGSSASGTSFWAKVGDDDNAPIENALSLLDTEQGKRPLRHYQRSSLRWMVHLYENNLNGILADEMGLGKTVQTIALLCYFAEYRNDWGPHLIVVPTTVVLNWKAELDRWAPGLKVLTYIGSAKERHQLRKGWTSEDAFHICITSYNLIVHDRKVFRRRPWGFLVLDEAHQVKNFMSIKWQSLFDLQAEYRLLLTGTPLQNSIMELWSLFHFLLPFASAFRSNAEFKEWFSNPMDAMITGRSSLNEDIVRRLQALIRPFMLRRLKKDVESQLPTKTEKVVLCHLSRRQRSLYDDYMQLADTRQKLRGGGAGGVLSVLLALRKVCDHPDLFEERPTISPLVLGYEALIEQLVPRAVLLLDNAGWVSRRGVRFPSFYVEDLNCDSTRCQSGDAETQQGLCAAAFASSSSFCCPRFSSAFTFESSLPWWAQQVHLHLPSVADDAAMETFARRFCPSDDKLADSDCGASCFGSQQALQRYGVSSTLHAAFADVLRASTKDARARSRRTRLAQQQRYYAVRCARNVHVPPACQLELREVLLARHFPELCPTVVERAAAMFPVVEKMCVYVPAALAAHPPRLRWLLPIAHAAPFQSLERASLAPLIGAVAKRQDALRCGCEPPRRVYDASFFLQELWAIQVRRSFSFPDKRLLIHDCGKLQFLEAALKEMRQEGHRVLIFTQFVNMLNTLERFLALTGVAYLRLDGSTKAETRQQLVDRFNADARITCMILSTRSGGVGLNLTGADTVIFYDSDWNPTMDLQAQDRCHRIGQTRPVTIYRLISEHTVEESILQKARERKKLNNVVIRGGQFHTIAGVSEQYDDSAAAFAALSDPVNLRSFFHDLDEDASVAAEVPSSAEASDAASRMLEEMALVEDEEDRRAGQAAQREIAEREAEEAAGEGGSEDDAEALSGDENNDDDDGRRARKRMRFEVVGKGGAASANLADLDGAGVLWTTKADAAAWRRRGANTLRDLYLGEDGGGGAALRDDHARGEETADNGDLPANEKLIRLAVRRRQRELVRKAPVPLDQFLTLQYGRCQRADAEDRYSALVETYTAQMDQLDSLDDEDEEDDEKQETRLPAFRVTYNLSSA